MNETEISKTIVIALSKLPGVRLFRNNTGMAWHSNKTQKYRDGSMLLQFPRLIKFGLFKGSSDHIGWVSVEVTPEMVGQRIAIFTAIESKANAKSKRSDDQKHFIKTVKAAGGRAGFAETIEQARLIITGEL